MEDKYVSEQILEIKSVLTNLGLEPTPNHKSFLINLQAINNSDKYLLASKTITYLLDYLQGQGYIGTELEILRRFQTNFIFCSEVDHPVHPHKNVNIQNVKTLRYLREKLLISIKHLSSLSQAIVHLCNKDCSKDIIEIITVFLAKAEEKISNLLSYRNNNEA